MFREFEDKMIILAVVIVVFSIGLPDSNHGFPFRHAALSLLMFLFLRCIFNFQFWKYKLSFSLITPLMATIFLSIIFQFYLFYTLIVSLGLIISHIKKHIPWDKCECDKCGYLGEKDSTMNKNKRQMLSNYEFEDLSLRNKYDNLCVKCYSKEINLNAAVAHSL